MSLLNFFKLFLWGAFFTLSFSRLSGAVLEVPVSCLKADLSGPKEKLALLKIALEPLEKKITSYRNLSQSEDYIRTRGEEGVSHLLAELESLGRKRSILCQDIKNLLGGLESYEGVIGIFTFCFLTERNIFTLEETLELAAKGLFYTSRLRECERKPGAASGGQ